MTRHTLIALAAILACSCGTPRQPAPEAVSNIIDLTSALQNPREVRLSELVDSITFVPLETSPQSNLSAAQQIRFSGDYIIPYNKFFDWNGKFLGTIGATGRGPLETLWPVSNAIFADGHFYSLGEKLLEFDTTGKATGKVRYLNSPVERTGALWRNVAFAPAGESFLAYNHPDSLYFIDRDFQIVGSRRVVEMKTEKSSSQHHADKFATEYNDVAVFYNFMNDTIFHVSNARLDPQWVVSYTGQQRPDLAFFEEWFSLLFDMGNAVMAGNGENSELYRRSKGKHIATAAYETDDYVILPMKELVFFVPQEDRPLPYITYFVKATGETIRVAGAGFVDDILGLGTFYPKWGVYREKMITSIWPYELHDLIAERQRTGTPVDPRLEALAVTVREGDNPILLFAHLKRQ